MGICVKTKQAWERPGTMKFWVGMVVFCNFSSRRWRTTLQSNLPYEVRKTVSSGMNWVLLLHLSSCFPSISPLFLLSLFYLLRQALLSKKRFPHNYKLYVFQENKLKSLQRKKITLLSHVFLRSPQVLNILLCINFPTITSLPQSNNSFLMD